MSARIHMTNGGVCWDHAIIRIVAINVVNRFVIIVCCWANERNQREAPDSVYSRLTNSCKMIGFAACQTVLAPGWAFCTAVVGPRSSMVPATTAIARFRFPGRIMIVIVTVVLTVIIISPIVSGTVLTATSVIVGPALPIGGSYVTSSVCPSVCLSVRNTRSHTSHH